MDWSIYSEMLTVNGDTRRERAITETSNSITKRAKRSPAYKTVLIDGVEQGLIVTSSTEMFYKKIDALPHDSIYAGSIVDWANHKWIITSVDCEDEIYQKGLMYQCNVCLKWQNADGDIVVRYGYSENLSLFASGTTTAKVMDGLQQWYRIQLPVDNETIKLRRDKRFLLDIIQDEPNAYIVTNREVVSFNFNPESIDDEYVFDGKGKVLALTLCQTQLSDKDNTDLMIADYVVPDEPTPEPDIPTESTVTISYSGNAEVKTGGSYKTFTATFKDAEGNVIADEPEWTLATLEGYENIPITTVTSDGKFKIKIPDCPELVNSYIRVTVTNHVSHSIQAYLDVKVVSIYG